MAIGLSLLDLTPHGEISLFAGASCWVPMERGEGLVVPGLSQISRPEPRHKWGKGNSAVAVK